MTDPVARLQALRALRARLFRLEPSRPLRTIRQAAAFVKERRVVMASGRSSLPLLTEAIAGRHIRGSWMADREVYRIHGITHRLRSHDVLSVSLILGKETVIDVSLGPAIERIARDAYRRGRAVRQLPPLAQQLLERVEPDGRVRMDRWGPPTRQARPARTLLERHLLVTSRDLHTERGYHTSIVTPWRASASSKRFSKAAVRLTFDQAQDRLLLAAVRSAVIAPEREVRRWFAFGADRIDALIAEGAIDRLTVTGRSWLTGLQGVGLQRGIAVR
jgi:hypothetical protein